MPKRIISCIAVTVLLLGLSKTAQTLFSSPVEAQEDSMSTITVDREASSLEPLNPSNTAGATAGATAGPPPGCQVGNACTNVGDICFRDYRGRSLFELFTNPLGGASLTGGVTGPDGIYYHRGYCLECAGGGINGPRQWTIFSRDACSS